MKSSNKEQTTEALIKALNLEAVSGDENIEGWATAWDLAEASNRSLSHTSKKIREGLRSGTIETKVFRVVRDGVLRCVPHYKLVKSVPPSCGAVEGRDFSNKTPKGKRR